jgi:hypothetical protein
LHHQAYFLLELSQVEKGEFRSTLSTCVDFPVNPLAKQGVYAEGNMANILETILIDISKTFGVVENVFIDA